MLMKAGGRIMSAADYEESLREYSPTVYVDGDRVESVADDPRLQPGVRAVGVTYDFAQKPEYGGLMLAEQATSGKTVNRMLHINRHSEDLLKLEAVRLGAARVAVRSAYLTHDALNAIYQATWQMTEDTGGEQHERFLSYLHRVQDEDLTLGVAMTDGKGDRSKRPGDQQVADSYVHITERRADGIVISGVKAIVTGGPTCMSCWSCPAGPCVSKMPTLRSAVRYPSMPKG